MRFGHGGEDRGGCGGHVCEEVGMGAAQKAGLVGVHTQVQHGISRRGEGCSRAFG